MNAIFDPSPPCQFFYYHPSANLTNADILKNGWSQISKVFFHAKNSLKTGQKMTRTNSVDWLVS